MEMAVVEVAALEVAAQEEIRPVIHSDRLTRAAVAARRGFALTLSTGVARRHPSAVTGVLNNAGFFHKPKSALGQEPTSIGDFLI